MLLALATCGNLPGWEKDDAPFEAALSAQGIPFEQPVWDDPNVDWSSYDACLIRTTWDYMEKLPAFLAWVEHVGSVTHLMNPAVVVQWNSAKTYLRELEGQGVPIAPTVWLEHGGDFDLAEILADKGWSQAFLKPVVGLCAWETLRFSVDPDGLSEAQAHLNRNLEFQSMMLQPYLKRVETVGEYSTIYFGGEFSHAVQKVPVTGDYRVQDDFGASDHPIDPTDDLLEISRSALQGVAKLLNLGEGAGTSAIQYARIDFLEDDGGCPVVNEVELIEPSLFFRHAPDAASVLAALVKAQILGHTPGES